MPEDDETRAEEIERLREERESIQQRLRRLRKEEIRSDGGITVEEFDGMGADKRRELKENDPEYYRALQEEKRKQGEEALGVVSSGPLKTRGSR